MKKLLSVTLVLLSFFVFMEACKKNKSSSRLTLYLTDDPANYSEVNIDLQKVLINTSSDPDNGWQEIALKSPGIYNLLDFRNALDTVIASVEIPAGKISQIRMVLGNNNSVVIDGTKYPLTTPSSMQSGLKFNVHADLIEGIEYKLWIDFDAARSIVTTGSGQYNLKPVIRTYTEALSGAIKGVVNPFDTQSWIYALNGADTLGSAIPDQVTGSFMLKGIPQGSYSVSFDAGNGYQDSTITPVAVTTGIVTDMGTITLHK